MCIRDRTKWGPNATKWGPKSKNDDFSKFHTNPLKYYEYSASGLKIVATDFPAHRNLNQHKNISYFRDQDNESFINAIITSNKNAEEIQIGYLETMDSRVKKNC